MILAMYIRGIRGATTVNHNQESDILQETKVLLETIIRKNNLQIDDIASIFFSVTQDLDAAFPAKAARDLGLTTTPLLCLREIPVKLSLNKCIRVLLHVNTAKKQIDMTHVYLNEAANLRRDHAAGSL